MKDSLGDRMKNNYENRAKDFLVRRTPVIMRLDGKAFHTLTKGCEKPFDEELRTAMVRTTIRLCEEIQGAKCAYTQSDEITILITDFDKLNTEAWFNYNIQKMASVSAALAAVTFTKEFGREALFDSRVFNIPKEEVVNNFIWRQKDWERNSLQMFCRAHFSHKELNKKNRADMHEMLHKKDLNWAHLLGRWKNGNFIYRKEDVRSSDQTIKVHSRWICDDDNCPVFTESRNVIEQYLIPEEE